MKNIVYIIVLFALVGCDGIAKKPTIENVFNNVEYFTDTSNLCFVATTSITRDFHDFKTITCIPCDSISKLSFKPLPHYIQQSLLYVKDTNHNLYYVSYVGYTSIMYDHKFLINIPSQYISDTSIFK